MLRHALLMDVAPGTRVLDGCANLACRQTRCPQTNSSLVMDHEREQALRSRTLYNVIQERTLLRP